MRYLSVLLCLGHILSTLASATTQEVKDRMEQEREAMAKVAAKYESPLNFGIDLSYSPRVYENYKYTDVITSNNSGYAGSVTFEWMPITGYGKAGIGLGTGFSIHPNVILIPADGTNDDQLATLYTVPIELHLSYHFDYIKNQIVVPYGKFGPSMTLIKQSSNFGFARDGINTFTGLDFAGGLELCLNPMEKSAARALDSNFGINISYLFAEYHVTRAMGSSSAFDLSRKEWRFGLRFEF